MFRVVGLAPEPFFLSFFLSLVVRFVILKEEEEIQVEGILFRYLSWNLFVLEEILQSR